MAKILPRGISDFKNFIEGDYYYVDKTLFIKELWQMGSGVTLICRPRRFGKTLNLSMLRYFFEKTDDSNAHLFTHTAIWQDEKYRALQGQYPVIFITFKDVKEESWERAYGKCVSIIAEEYKRHYPFIRMHAEKIEAGDLAKFHSISEGNGDHVAVSESLQFLSRLLSQITKKKVIVLFDEYDASIHGAYQYNYYDEMTSFMRGLLSAVFKDNRYIEHGVLTGILRTAKEGIFSGLNNLTVCTFLNHQFADKFGFVAGEVDSLLKNQGIEFESETIKNWYNGYRAGDETLLYNPWSIIHCAQNKGELNAYWVNTSDNAIIGKLLVYSTEIVKTELESLLTGGSLIKDIDEAFIFPGIIYSPSALWSLLVFSGYITYSHRKPSGMGSHTCSLVIPNREMYVLYKLLLSSIFQRSFTTTTIEQMLHALRIGNTQQFSHSLQEFVLNSMSYYDFSDNEPEKSYHLFILGLLVFLSDVYDIRSNRESGTGRYDLMLIPKDKAHTGIIIECKKTTSDDEAVFQVAVDKALEQIKEKNYKQELKAQGIVNVLVYVIVFYGKKLLVKSEKM